MQIYYDSAKAKEIETKILEKFREGNQNRTKIHLSDFCYCPMKVFNRLIGMESMNLEDIAGLLMVGNVGQELIQILYPEEWAEWEDESILPSHVDLLEDGKVPLEIKWSSSKVTRSSDIKKSWVKQLMSYMAIHRSNIGWMLIMNLTTRRFTAWKIIIDDDEIENLRLTMEMFRDNTYEAVKIYLDGEVEKALAMMEIELTEDQVYECKWCNSRPGRKRTRLGLKGLGCPKYLNKKGLETQLRQVRF